MSKQKKREINRLRQIIDSLQVDPVDAPVEEINEALADDDISKLRVRLYQQAREIASAQRQEQKPVSKALQKFIDAMNVGTALPRDTNDAFAKAVQEYQIPHVQVPSPAPEQVHAFRKGYKELSEKDRDILEKAAERLRKRRDEEKK